MATRFGPFQLLRKMGAGATAEVFLATGPNPKGVELLALKIVLPHLAEEEGLRKTMLKEAQTAALLRHPNIVEIYEVGELNGRPYLAMELVPGWSLSALQKKLKAKGDKLSHGEACAVIRRAALGLHFAHEAHGADGRALGLVHRDVSPQNIIVSQDGEVKVVDFGLAKATQTSKTQTGGLRGKLPYMPPEQLRSEPLDRRTDVFALGAVLWELVCGSRLYPGETEAEIFQKALFAPLPHPDEVAKGLPRALVDLLQRAVERDLGRRLPSAEALAEALERLVPADEVSLLASRVRSVFAPLPRTADEALGLPSTPESEPEPTRLRKPKPERAISAMARARVRSRASEPAPVSRGDVTTPQPLPEPEEVIAPTEARPSLRARPSRGNFFVALLVLGLLAAAGGSYVATRLRPAPPSAEALPTESLETPPAPEEKSSPSHQRSPHKITGKGTLILQADTPAFVKEGGHNLGMTPLTVSLPSGRHRLSVQSVDGSGSANVEVTIPNGDEVTRRVALRGQ